MYCGYVYCMYELKLTYSYVYLTEYSVGVIYLVVLNLPRSKRYLRENIILSAIIPGPTEPKLTMNSFLKPLVIELQEFWSGVMISCKTHPLKNICVRAAVICCTCDIPATRKLCGFLGHFLGIMVNMVVV